MGEGTEDFLHRILSLMLDNYTTATSTAINELIRDEDLSPEDVERFMKLFEDSDLSEIDTNTEED